MQKILLAEDDKSIVRNLTEFLKGEGFAVKCAAGQREALELAGQEPFDLALLDVALSEGSGFALCAALKAEHQMPVIFLTASGDEGSTVAGFALGAEDYIAKPFRPRELVMRIKNVLRLTGGSGKSVRIGAVTVNTENGTAEKNGRDLGLSALEYRLLLLFLNNRGQVLTRTRLLESIWDAGGDFVNDNTLTVYIKRLREKLEDDPQSPKIIRTVRGMGYKMEAE